MEAQTILTADLLDIIFEDRNKEFLFTSTLASFVPDPSLHLLTGYLKLPLF